jgi:hypothetical protein
VTPHDKLDTPLESFIGAVKIGYFGSRSKAGGVSPYVKTHGRIKRSPIIFAAIAAGAVPCLTLIGSPAYRWQKKLTLMFLRS